MILRNSSTISCVLVVGVGVVAVVGVARSGDEEESSRSTREAIDTSNGSETVEAGTVVRVGGSPEAEVEVVERSGKTIYRAGKAQVGEALPAGYPRPTAPGAIEVKRYPSVRRAEISGRGDGEFRMMGGKTSAAFWPLFKHIKKREIAMTAPVEMDYPGMSSDGEAEQWSMSFLYRTPELGETGFDGPITVYDAAPVTVISIGVRGVLSERRVRESLATLEAWIDSDPAWEATGDPRTFGYNGPSTGWWNRWWEVQIPILASEADQ